MIEQDNDDYGYAANSDATRMSMTSLSDANLPVFSRDQPGRQSMSEKRHATLDAKATDTYQKRKKARDDRLRQKEMMEGNNKMVRWKKSASVESLHIINDNETLGTNTDNFLTAEEREMLKNQYVRASSVRVSRARGCNESFRQAVDRSYEDKLPANIARQGEDYEIEDLDDKQRVEKKRSGDKHLKNSKLLRNFGAMFRLGSGSGGHQGSRSKSANRKSLPSIGNAQPHQHPSMSSSSSLPSSQSVPNYQVLVSKNKAVEDQHQQKSDQKRPQQRSPETFYDHLPTSAMFRPGSRVGIADPAQNSASSDYYDIQRHLQQRASRNDHFLSQQQPAQPRSRSNPARGGAMRPKSNFYEYDVWNSAAEAVFNDANSRAGVSYYSKGEPPAVPQKPSAHTLKQHFSSLHHTAEHVYGYTAPPANNDPAQRGLPGVHTYGNPYVRYHQHHQSNPPHLSLQRGPLVANLPKMS